MGSAMRDSSGRWVTDAADLLTGDVDVPTLDLTVDSSRRSMPNVELGPFCDLIFAPGAISLDLDLFGSALSK